MNSLCIHANYVLHPGKILCAQANSVLNPEKFCAFRPILFRKRSILWLGINNGVCKAYPAKASVSADNIALTKATHLPKVAYIVVRKGLFWDDVFLEKSVLYINSYITYEVSLLTENSQWKWIKVSTKSYLATILGSTLCVFWSNVFNQTSFWGRGCARISTLHFDVAKQEKYQA